MLLPEIIHLPAVLLLAATLGSGIALSAVVPYAAHLLHDSPRSWPTALAAVLISLSATRLIWYAFRVARKAGPDARFLGFSSWIWKVSIPIAYVTGVGFRIYLSVMLYL
jgi:hypothetical protein